MLGTVWGIMIMGVLPVTVGTTLLLISLQKGCRGMCKISEG